MLINLLMFSPLAGLGFAKIIVAQQLSKLSLGELFLVSLFGFALVFFVLLILQGIIGLIAKSVKAPAVETTDVAASKVNYQMEPQAAKASEKAQVPAVGSQGELDLNGVDPRTAAMLMAIVAERLQKPLNRLRFLSIQEDTSNTESDPISK